MKVDRHCPRCRAHAYHFVNTPATDDDALRDLPLHRWPATLRPRRVTVYCAACAHTWWTHLSRAERDLPPADDRQAATRGCRPAAGQANA